MSRSYVRDLMSLLGDCDYYYYHKNDKKLLADIDHLQTVSEMIDADIVIDTWIGQYHYKGMDAKERVKNRSSFLGCNFPHYYAVMSQAYDDLGLRRAIKSIDYYIPDIAYEKFYINNIKEFFCVHAGLSVIVGRSSGPYSFSITRKNVQDKKFVCICNVQKDAWMLGGQIDVRWTNNSSVKYLLSMLSSVISECGHR